nr:MAG TPA: Acetone carboxylase alpha subunit [Caudoviricetes sp.]
MSATTCSIEECPRPVAARGICQRHYLARWRAGQLDPPTVPPRVDLVGRRFGDLVATDWDGTRRRWICRCDCGANRLVRAGRLTGGEVRSCGHHHARRPRSPEG